MEQIKEEHTIGITEREIREWISAKSGVDYSGYRVIEIKERSYAGPTPPQTKTFNFHLDKDLTPAIKN